MAEQRNEMDFPSFPMFSWWAPTTVPLEADWPPLDILSPNLVVVLLVLISIVRFLHLFSSPAVPEVSIVEKSDKNKILNVVNNMPILKQPYKPPHLWGRNGHIQTAAYGVLGHANLRRTADRRISNKLVDGSTITFDIFEPLTQSESGSDVTLALTPGIANSSESNYIRTLVHCAQEAGYRCCVLNHLGALRDVPLTGNRIFCYGGIEELTSMMDWMMEQYPHTKFINIGFSMGGNLTTKYLLSLRSSENLQKCNRILLGLSVGQGYCAVKSTPMYHDWQNGRRAYNYIITENMKRLLRTHYAQAVEPHVKSGLIDEQRLWSSTSIVSLDENYSRRVFGLDDLESFYKWVSCFPHLDDLPLPMIFLNALDDPIVPEGLWKPVQELCKERDDVCFILTQHGGHLGFLEGSSFHPNSVTWLDRFIVQMVDAAVKVL